MVLERIARALCRSKGKLLVAGPEQWRSTPADTTRVCGNCCCAILKVDPHQTALIRDTATMPLAGRDGPPKCNTDEDVRILGQIHSVRACTGGGFWRFMFVRGTPDSDKRDGIRAAILASGR